MATVRFSGGLKNVIIGNANKMFADKVGAAEGSFNKLLLDGLYEQIFSEYMPHINALPPEFFRKVSAFDIHPDPEMAHSKVRYDVGRAVPIPPNDFSLPEFRFVGHYSIPDIYLKNTPKWAAIREEHNQWRERVRQAREKQQEFTNMVETIIHAHVTLAPALKVWPALWELLPEETKEKHKEVKDKKSHMKEELEGVDLGKLTAAVTVHKLRGG
jgi:hypothetical protein